MSPAAGPALHSNHQSQLMMPPPAMMSTNPTVPQVGLVTPTAATAEIMAKDAMISWYRGEFAAANAIIDALINHLAQVNSCRAADYKTAFSVISRRRQNWFPVLHMQKYFSIAEVIRELKNVAETNNAVAAAEEDDDSVEKKGEEEVIMAEKEKEELVVEVNSGDEKSGDEAVEDEEASVTCVPDGGGFLGGPVEEDSPGSEITDTGSHEEQPNVESRHDICENHEDCGSRREQIKMRKGFVAKEPIKGHTVNVVKGLKVYDSVFREGELSKMTDFVYELRAAGQSGQLSDGTYILFNKQIKGNKREQIHLGVPLFGTVKDNDQKANPEPIPVLLQSVISHLVQWQIIPESRQPNGCIINYFDEEEHSQPYLKPPHVDQPICTLLLSETTLAFGRTLVNDGEGNFKGNLMLSVKEGSVLLMRNNSADTARHAVCPAPTKRVSLTFFRVRPEAIHKHNHFIVNSNHKGMMMLGSPTQAAATTLWQPAGFPPNACFPSATPTMIPNGGFEPMNMIPRYGVINEPPPPVVMLAHPLSIRPAAAAAVIMNQQQRKMMLSNGGTGVFLPWTNRGTRKLSSKHLPPRAQRSKLLDLQPPPTHPPSCNAELHHHVIETMSDPGSDVKDI